MEIELLNRRIEKFYQSKNVCYWRMSRLIDETEKEIFDKVQDFDFIGNHALATGHFCAAIYCYDNVLAYRFYPSTFEYFQEALIAQLTNGG